METLTKIEPDAARRGAFTERMFGALVTTMETMSTYLGLRLGYYEQLARRGAATSGELAAWTRTDERYTREWLEQQAVAGVLDVQDAAEAERRRFVLPPEHAEVLLHKDSSDFLGFIPPMTAAFAGRLPALLAAFRSGDGVAWDAYGEDLWAAQGDQNRAFLRNFFAPVLLPQVAEVHARLSRDPPAPVGDLACGVGWASIAIAERYPAVRVDGLDLDAAAIAAGTRIVEEQGVSDRVTLAVRDATAPDLKGRYDLVVIVEAVHDLAHPVEVLAAARGLLAPGGSVIVVDENVAESFVAPGPMTERAFYGFSVLACLANGRTEPGSAMTGTVMRPSTLARYAQEAGFGAVDVVPVAHDFFRFYHLRP